VTGEANNSLVVAASTLAVRRAVPAGAHPDQQLVDRRFNRSRYDAIQTVKGFIARVRGEVKLDALTGDLVSTVNRTPQQAHVSLWLRR
jgi:hypothetical protein